MASPAQSVPQSSPAHPPSSFQLRVPGHNSRQAHEFLASVHGGSLAGAGRAASVDFAGLRNAYETHAHELQGKVDAMRQAGSSEAEVAQTVVRERTSFARATRLRQGPGATVVLEVRDWKKYGVGGRTYGNLAQKAEADIARGAKYTKGLTRDEVLIRGAMRPQALLSPQFLEAARYLKYGGPVMLVLGAGLTAHEIASAPKQDRNRVIAEEAGGFIGGELAAEGAAIALLTVGTGGLGLVAIAGVAAVGVVGGVAGSWLADKLYYAHHAHVVQQARSTGQVPSWSIRHFLP